VNPDFIRANEVHRLCGNPAKLEACIGSLQYPRWKIHCAGCCRQAHEGYLSIDPVRFPLTGIGRYTFELARHLKKYLRLSGCVFSRIIALLMIFF